MNESKLLHIQNLLLSQDATSDTILSLSLQHSQMLCGPSGCGKSRLARMIQEYCDAVDTDLNLLSQHRLETPTLRPDALILSSIPTVSLITPDVLSSLPPTLADLWNVHQWMGSEQTEIVRSCEHCGGTVHKTPSERWESILIERYKGLLLTLSIPQEKNENTQLPMTGKILIDGVLYSLDDDEERQRAQETTAPYVMLVYDRLRVIEEKYPRIRTAIQEALNAPLASICLSEHNPIQQTVSWISVQLRCSQCGKEASTDDTSTDKEPSGTLGPLSVKEAFHLSLQRLGLQLPEHHPLGLLLQRASALGLGEHTLATACADCSLTEQLLACCTHRHEHLFLIDSMATLLDSQDWQDLQTGLKALETVGSCVIMIDSRTPKACLLPVVPFPVSKERPSLSPIRQGLFSRSKLRAPPEIYLESSSLTLATGTHYTLTAEHDMGVLSQLHATLKQMKQSHGLSVLRHEHSKGTVRSRHTVASYLGVDRVLRQHFSETLEAKAAGISPGDLLKNTEASNSLKFLGQGYLDYLQCNITMAASILQHLPKVGNRLLLAESLGLGNLTLSQKVQDISLGELQRLALLTGSTSRRLPYIWILDHPSWCLDEYSLGRLEDLFQSLCKAGALLISRDSYPWRGTQF